MSERSDVDVQAELEVDEEAAQAQPHASSEVTTLEFVRRVFSGSDAAAWLVHVATGQVLWANDRARGRSAAERGSADGAARVDAHASLLAAHRSGFRVREHAVSIDGYSLALFVAVERRRAVPSWGRGPSIDARASRTWWIEERNFAPSLASVAALLVRGASVEDVARELEITPTSARTYIQRVRERLPENELWWITRRSHSDA